MRRSRSGFTLVELLVTVSIIAILASLLFPALRSGLDEGRSAKCASNLRQIGIALATYAGDNNNLYPQLTDLVAQKDWDQGAIAPYLPLRLNGQQNAVFTCPAAHFTGLAWNAVSRAYSAADGLMGINPATGQVTSTYTIPRNRLSIAHADTTVLLFDATQAGTARYASLVTPWSVIYNSPDVKSSSTNQVYIDYRHARQARFLMADGHVEARAHNQASTLTQAVWQGQ